MVAVIKQPAKTAPKLDAGLLVDIPRAILEDYAGPASYQPGGFVVATLQGPSKVEYGKVLQSTGGYTADVAAISGSNITIQAYTGGGTEVASGTNLTSIVFTVLEQGM